MKRILCLILLLCMLLPTVIACKKDVEQNEDESAGDTASTETETEDPLAKYNVYDDIGTRDMGGKVITIATSDYDTWVEEIASEGFTGETVNDAIFARNMEINRRLNCEIKSLVVSYGGLDTYKIGDYVLTQMQSGLHEYDLALTPAYSSMPKVAQNAWVDLRSLSNINFAKSYWSQHYNEQISIGDAQYFASGYASLSFYRKTYVTFLNETMLNTVPNAPDIFQVIADGKWTIGYQKELAKSYYSDTNGNGKDKFDKFGLIVDPYNSVDGFLSSCEIDIVGKDSQNCYEWQFDIDKVAAVSDAIIDLYMSDGVWVNEKRENFANMSKYFSDKQTLMSTDYLERVESENFRGMKDVYLILPIPRYSENQEGYYSYLHDMFLSYAIPNTKVDEAHLDDVSAVLEVLASEGHRTVAPAYYELALKTKYVPDGKSVELLDDIIANAYIDCGVVISSKLGYVVHKFREVIESAVTKGTGNLASSQFNAEWSSKQRWNLKAFTDEIINLKYAQ